MSTEGDGWSTWPAPAKLNVFLQITGRRADGYHELQTVFQLLDWGDEIRLRVRTDGRIERSRGAAGVPAEDDLVVRAARLLQQCSGSRFGADIAVDKRIPVGGGFGGGSSNAATVLCALDQLWATGLGHNRLAELGLQLGADVPVFVHGRSAWAEGVGDRLTPITLPQRWYVLLDPGVHASTAELFQAPDLTRNANPLKMADFDFDKHGGNAFEPVLRRRVPRVGAALVALAQFGKAALTGTGSGCFAEFVTRASANEAAASLAGQGWSVWVAAGVTQSNLLDRLIAEATPDAVERHEAKR